MYIAPIIINWEILPKEVRAITYFVNGVKIGYDDAGFDKILALLKTDKQAKKVILKINAVTLGGESLESTLPFSNRFGEFKKALGTKKLIYEMV